MSILNNIFSDILCVIFPRLCLVCGESMNESEGMMICPTCFSKISITRFWDDDYNPMVERARDLHPMVVHGVALLFYDGYSRPLIHRIKYHNHWRGALYLGELLGAYLAQSELYGDIDVVVPIPIHPLRRLKRTYNQSEYIASGIAREMGVATNFNALYRARYSVPQAVKNRADRWGNDLGGFQIRDAHELRGKHILLVDDVYTSGATILGAIGVINASVSDCRISVATLATSHKYQM